MKEIKDHRHIETMEGLKEQAGFRTGKSCTSQLLNRTQHIKDGYQEGKITGTVFVDLSAAYDIVVWLSTHTFMPVWRFPSIL